MYLNLFLPMNVLIGVHCSQSIPHCHGTSWRSHDLWIFCRYLSFIGLFQLLFCSRDQGQKHSRTQQLLPPMKKDIVHKFLVKMTVVKVFPIAMTETEGPMTCGFFAVICLLSAFFSYYFVPETRGKMSRNSEPVLPIESVQNGS